MTQHITRKLLDILLMMIIHLPICVLLAYVIIYVTISVILGVEHIPREIASDKVHKLLQTLLGSDPK